MPTYDLTGDFVSDDVKFGDTVRLTVERRAAPTKDEAERLLLPAAEQSLRRWRGEVYPFGFTRISISERADARIPETSDFPPGTEFVIKEFDVPLTRVPGRGWSNWYGGTPRPYDTRFLRVDNNWPAESFEEWVGVVKSSLGGGGAEGKPDWDMYLNKEPPASAPPRKYEFRMWHQVRVELPAGENVFTHRELEDAIKYAQEIHPDATEGLPDDTYIVISRQVIEGHETVWAAGVTRPCIAPSAAVIYGDHEKEGLHSLLSRVSLFLPEFKRRYCDPQR